MKQKKQAGMTLVELLCALAVLLLVSACMVLGVSLAVKSYERSVTRSEAQVLCSTLQATVSDELRYSGTLYYREGRLVGFFSQDHGGEEAQDGFQADENGHILLGGAKLLPKKAYPHGMRAAVDLTGYDAAAHIFSVTVTVTDRSGGELARAAFQVEKLNASDSVTLS